jgi:IS30 family transposase
MVMQRNGLGRFVRLPGGGGPPLSPAGRDGPPKGPGDHTAETVAAAMIEAMSELPEHLRRSITWDRGSEMADWEHISMRLNTPVFFCNPHSPWQRGTNENTNRLLRFWFEKGSNLGGYTKADLKRVADKLNTRPRPTLGLNTPAQRLTALISQAA